MARRIPRYVLPAPFYAREAIPAPSHFVAVRDYILTLEHPKWPIWRLRLAPDLLAELHGCHEPPAWVQERFTHGVTRFEGRVLCVAEAEKADLDRLPQRPFQQITFALECRAGPWQWHPRRTQWYGDLDTEAFWQVRTRFLTVVRAGHFEALPRACLLQPACLLCSKRLTDPLSMARLIGPECAGTARQAGVLLWDVSLEPRGADPEQLVLA